MSYDEKFMKRALELAQKAADMGEVPVGAVVVRNGVILGEGYNRRESDKDPTAHAEILAIKEASSKLEAWRLSECELYVTLEPCIMCAGAIINARLANVFIGTKDPKAGAVMSNAKLLEESWTNHKSNYSIENSELAEQSSKILKDFFSDLRTRNKQK